MRSPSSENNESDPDAFVHNKTYRDVKPCPLNGCAHVAQNVKRHLMVYHRIPVPAILDFMQRYAVELGQDIKSAKSPRPRLPCRYCAARVQRMDIHVRRTHTFNRQEALREFKVVRNFHKRKAARRAAVVYSSPESLSSAPDSDYEVVLVDKHLPPPHSST